MSYEEFKAIMTKAFDVDMTMETMWKLTKLSRDMDEFRQNFALASDKDDDEDNSEGNDE